MKQDSPGVVIYKLIVYILAIYGLVHLVKHVL